MKRSSARLIVWVLGAVLALAACTGTRTPPITERSNIFAPTALPGTTETVPVATKVPSPKPEKTPVESVKAAVSGVQVDFYHPWTSETGAEMRALIGEFNVENEWGIEVREFALGSGSEVKRAVDNGLLNRDHASVVAAPPEVLRPWLAQDGVLADLSGFVDDPDHGLTEEDFVPVFWQQDPVNGQRAGVPATGNATVLVYNRTWAEELGFDEAPTDLESMGKQLCAAASENNNDDKADNNGTGGLLLDPSPGGILPWLRSFGLESLAVGGSVDFDQPELAEMFATFRGWVTEGCAWAATNQWGRLSFADRQSMVLGVAVSELDDLDVALAANGSKDEWTVLPYPGEAGGLVVDGVSYGVVNGSEEQELAGWLFVRWLSLKEQSARILQAQHGLPVLTALLGEEVGGAAVQGPRVEVLSWVDGAVTPPATVDWSVAALILQDGFWRAIQLEPPADNYAALLEEMNVSLQALSGSR